MLEKTIKLILACAFVLASVALLQVTRSGRYELKEDGTVFDANTGVVWVTADGFIYRVDVVANRVDKTAAQVPQAAISRARK